MLTIILEGAGGVMLFVAAMAQFRPPVTAGSFYMAAVIGAVALGLCFLAFGRFMGWPV